MSEEKLPAIQALWIGGELGEIELLSAASFLAHGHPYHLYVYSDVKNIPAGVRVMDANQIIPAKEIYQCYYRGYAPFSDWFRWELLYKKGGYWMDTDMICLKKHDLPNEVILPKEDLQRFCTAAIRFSKGHPLVKAMVNRCRHPKRTALQDSFVRPLGRKYIKLGSLRSIKDSVRFMLLNKKETRISFGAHLASVVIMHEFLDSDARWQKIRNDKMADLGRTYFYPVPWEDYATLMDDTYKDVPNPFPGSYAVHLWVHMHGKGKERQAFLSAASPNSFYMSQKKRYLS